MLHSFFAFRKSSLLCSIVTKIFYNCFQIRCNVTGMGNVAWIPGWESWLVGRFRPSVLFVKAVLLERSQVYPVADCSWLLPAGRAQWRNCSTDRMTCKEKKD